MLNRRNGLKPVPELLIISKLTVGIHRTFRNFIHDNLGFITFFDLFLSLTSCYANHGIHNLFKVSPGNIGKGVTKRYDFPLFGKSYSSGVTNRRKSKNRPVRPSASTANRPSPSVKEPEINLTVTKHFT